MKLTEGIKDIIARFKIEVVSTRQFVNLLDDVGAFKDEPTASKKVMKGLLESGFGDLLCQIVTERTGNWQNSVRKCVSDYITQSGFKDELVNHHASCLLYGVGIIDELPKFDKRPIVTPKPTSRIKDPRELLYALKQEYLSALSELMTITTDEFGHKYGYYSSEANTKLYVLDAKIRILAKELGQSDIPEWLDREKKKIERECRPSENQIKQALKDELATLTREYRALMEKGHIVKDDEFGLKSAEFPSNVISDLQAIEKKIIIIGKRQGEDKQSWIDKTKSDFLASKSSPASARNGILDQLKNDYEARLIQLDKETKSGDIDFSDSELKELRRKLINLGSLLGNNMEQWCDTENENISNARKVRFAKRKKRNIIISAVAGIALLIGGGETISYVSSSDARAQYETTMASANAEYAQGKYAEALTLYQKAENEYDASFNSSSYKGDAHSKAAEASAKIIADWENSVRPLLESNHVAKAKSLTLALPANLVLEGNAQETFRTLSAQIDQDLEARATQIVDELLNDIYTHQGKLSDAGKQELDEMIAVVPNNYWLNFIKDKTK